MKPIFQQQAPNSIIHDLRVPITSIVLLALALWLPFVFGAHLLEDRGAHIHPPQHQGVHSHSTENGEIIPHEHGHHGTHQHEVEPLNPPPQRIVVLLGWVLPAPIKFSPLTFTKTDQTIRFHPLILRIMRSIIMLH